MDKDDSTLIGKIIEKTTKKEPWFSYEFFPPREENEKINLNLKIKNLISGGPLFCDITWQHLAQNESLRTAEIMRNKYGINETMLHMTCVNMTVTEILNALNEAKEIGIRNIMALRGDMFNIKKEKCFSFATDLVKFIRNHFGTDFVVSVAGYPEGHPEAESYEKDMEYLKQKVKAGADFIVTQLCFDVKTILKFISDCRKIDITCPIVVGFMPIQSYNSLVNIITLTKIVLPREIRKRVDDLKDNEDALRKYGIDFGVKFCRELLNSGVFGLHFYTINQDEVVMEILKQIGLWNDGIVPHCVPLAESVDNEHNHNGARISD